MGLPLVRTATALRQVIPQALKQAHVGAVRCAYFNVATFRNISQSTVKNSPSENSNFYVDFEKLTKGTGARNSWIQAVTKSSLWHTIDKASLVKMSENSSFLEREEMFLGIIKEAEHEKSLRELIVSDFFVKGVQPLPSVMRSWSDTLVRHGLWRRISDAGALLNLFLRDDFKTQADREHALLAIIASLEKSSFKFKEDYQEFPDLLKTTFGKNCEESGIWSAWNRAIQLHSVIDQSTIGSTVTTKTAYREPYLTTTIMGNMFIRNQPIKEVCRRMNEYSADQQEGNKIVFFHGQAWSWHLYEMVYRKLEQKVHQKDVPDNFVFLRWKEKELYADHTREQEIFEKGAVGQYRPSALFTNAALLANDAGSNSVKYVVGNFDQSIISERNQHTVTDIFEEFNLHDEIEFLQKNNSLLFERLFDLHRVASKYGNFISISIPRPLVSKIAYSARSGGFRYFLPVKNGESCCPLEIIDYNQGAVPFYSEFVIVLGPTVCNPERARQAGIEIKQWNTANQEIIAQLDALINEIIDKAVALKK